MPKGIIDFDEQIQGGSTDEKIRNMNAMFKAHAGRALPTVRFDAKTYSTSVPIELWSGMSLIGGAGLPAREYTRHPTIRYTGAAGTSLFKYTGTQTNQSYPRDGSPRDISVAGIQFSGGSTVDCVESATGAYAGKVGWMINFHNCGWNGFRRVWHGYVDGASITGTSHMQAFSDTAVWWRGSEAVLFGMDSFSFVDSGVLGAKPMIRWGVSKGEIGRGMATTRKNGMALLIDTGSGIRVHGFSADSQSSDPCYGANIRIEGNARGVIISDCTFKGTMSNPTLGYGGATKNRGIIHVESSDDVVIDHCAFMREGSNLGPTTTPLVFAGPTVRQNGIRVGPCTRGGFDGVLLQSSAGQFCEPDRSFTVRTA